MLNDQEESKSKLHLSLKNKRNVCVQMQLGKAQMEDVHKI